MNLVYKHEKTLFTIAAVLAGLFWLLITVFSAGLVLIYILFLFLFYLFAQAAFISYIKGTGVKITEKQFPDLHAKLLASCEKVGQKEIPDAYLLRTDFFNALATRFLGRNFIVLFSDVVDALSERPDAVDFYIGHEIGHIHRKHLLWSAFLAPAKVTPLLGSALRRAEEYTCDRYGVACSQSEDDVKAAIAALAAGDTRWQHVDVDAYVEQTTDTSGFWMSFNELTGDYPWLTKRMATALAVYRDEEIEHPRRSIFAWILAALTPRFGAGGGGAGVIAIIAIIGILAAIALPAYKQYSDLASLAGMAATLGDDADYYDDDSDSDWGDATSDWDEEEIVIPSSPENYKAAYESALPFKKRIEDYYRTNGDWPEDFTDFGDDESFVEHPASDSGTAIYAGGILGINVDLQHGADERYILIEPTYNGDNDTIEWTCSTQGLESQEGLPDACL